MDDRYFYHAFPRRRHPSDDVSVKGLDILKSIAVSGLLLTPEVLEFRESLDDGTLSEPAFVQQKRISFTELSPSELGEHAKVFGPFALEWEVQTLRRMGASPVFYVPFSKSPEALEGLPAALLMRMGEVEGVLDSLDQLGQVASKAAPDEPLVVTNNGEPIGQIRCTAGGAEDLLGLLQHDRQSITHLLAAVRAFWGFFYPTENLEYTGPLAYYRQREWRIVANTLHLGEPVTSDPNDEEKERLLRLDRDFFSRELAFRSGSHRRIDQSMFMREHLSAPVIQSVRRVVVPEKCSVEAREILEGSGSSVSVVSLESLAAQ